MFKKLTLVIIASCLIAACTFTTSPTANVPGVTEIANNTSQAVSTTTDLPAPASAQTLLPQPTITLPAIKTIQPHLLALNLSNAATGMKKLKTISMGAAKDIAFSPDGKKLAVAGDLGVYFFETTGWTQTDFWAQDFVSRIAYSPDGSKLAVAKADQILVLDLNQQRIIYRKENQTDGEIFRFIYGNNNIVVLASGHIDFIDYSPEALGSLIVWQAHTGKTIYTTKVKTQIDALSDIQDVDAFPSADISPDGMQIAIWDGKEISLIESASGKITNSFPTGSAHLVFGADGKKILYTTFEQTNTSSGWDISTKKYFEAPMATYCEQLFDFPCLFSQKIELFQKLQNSQQTPDVAIDKNKKLLAIIENGAVALWDFETSARIERLNFSNIDYLATGIITIDGQQHYIVVTSNGAQTLIWDIDSEKLIGKIENLNPVTGLDISPDQHTLATINDLGVISLLDVPANTPSYTIDLQGQISAPIKFTRNGTGLIAPAKSQPKLVEVNLQTGNIVERGESGLSIPLNIFGLGTDDHLRTLGWSTQEQAQAVLDLETKDLITFPSFNPDTEVILTLATNPGVNYVAVGTIRGHIQVADINSKKIISDFSAHSFWVVGDGMSGGVRNLEFTHHSDLLLSGGYDNIKLWNIQTGNPLRIIHPGGLAIFTDDDRYLITTDDGLIDIWGIPEN